MLPSLDPNKENYPKFAKTWETFQFAFLIFFGYTYIVSLCAALYPTIHVGTYIQSGIGVLFIILGNSLGKIRRNYFIGFKLPWTLSNDDIWNKTHRLGGKMFMLAGVIFLI